MFTKIEFETIAAAWMKSRRAPRTTSLLMKSACLFVFCGCASLSPSPVRHPIKNAEGAHCEIIVPKSAGPVAAFAGEELRTFLGDSLGIDIPLKKTPSKNTVSIILGAGEFAEQAGINAKKLPRDSFVIKSIGDDILIVGKDDSTKDPRRQMNGGVWSQLYERGTLFGTYAFLERFLGIRFYFPGKTGTIIPRLKSLNLPAIDIFERPDFSVRTFSTYSGTLPDGQTGKDSWPYKNLNYYRLRMQTRYVPNCHGLARLDHIRRFAETHPEYFALMDNGERYNRPDLGHTPQLCFSSGIVNEIFHDAKAFLSGHSAESRNVRTHGRFAWDPSAFQPGFFNVMPQDGFYKCRCAKCQKHFSQGPQATSDFIWNYAIHVAERLEKENVPGHVTMMAYTCYSLPPVKSIPKNMIVMTQVRGPWGLAFPTVKQANTKKIMTWSDKLGRPFSLWTYPNKYGSLDIPDIPNSTPKCVGKFYETHAPRILGSFMESETDHFIYNYLNFYVFAKVAWDNSTNVDELLDEHYATMFEAAAPRMEKIFERFESNWFKVMGTPINTRLGPSARAVSNRTLWNDIYSQAELDRLAELFQQAKTLANNSPDALARVKFMEKHFLSPLLKRRERYFADKREIEDLQMYAATTSTPLNIDGILDEQAWMKTDDQYLVPLGKKKDATPVKTIVKTLQDDQRLYFAIECEEPNMTMLVARNRARDDHDIWRDSSIELFLNPSGDRRNYGHVIVNAAGSVSDSWINDDDGNRSTDWDWSSEAEIAIKKHPDAWTVEIAFPKNALPDFSKTGFPINVTRNRKLAVSDPERASHLTWSPYLKKGFHEIENFGNLVFAKKREKNLIKNGSFKEKTQGRFFGNWYAPKSEDMTHGESWKIDTTRFIKDGQSICLRSPSKNGIRIVQYLPDLKPNTEYLLSFWVKTRDVERETGKQSGACVNIWDEKNRWFPKHFPAGTTPWTKEGIRFKTGPKTNQKHPSSIQLRLLNASGEVWFDDVRLRPVKREETKGTDKK